MRAVLGHHETEHDNVCPMARTSRYDDSRLSGPHKQGRQGGRARVTRREGTGTDGMRAATRGALSHWHLATPSSTPRVDGRGSQSTCAHHSRGCNQWWQGLGGLRHRVEGWYYRLGTGVGLQARTTHSTGGMRSTPSLYIHNERYWRNEIDAFVVHTQ
jgi:hypothetical protein